MNIVQALQQEESDIRVTNHDKWLVWDHDQFVVYYLPYGKRKPRIIEETRDEDLAVAALLRESQE